LRFMEWQQRLRAVYRPGLAETKEAECYEAVYTALHERYTRQKAENIVHSKAGTYEIEMDKAERWKLLHFSEVVNSKSYYRKFAGLIDRVKRSMIDNEIIAEIREKGEEDQRGHEKKGRKTPFVVMMRTLK